MELIERAATDPKVFHHFRPLHQIPVSHTRIIPISRVRKKAFEFRIMLIYAIICIGKHMEKMFNIKQICLELGVARRTVHYWIAKGQLKAFHLGGKRLTRVWEKDLLRFVHGRTKSRNR